MKTVYYTDSAHDDFAGNHIKTRKVTESFAYINSNLVWRLAAFLLYYVIACPLVFLYCKILFGIKIRGKRNVYKIRRGGLFLYGNHTHMADSFIPSLLAVPGRRNYIIANPDAVSIPGLKTIVSMLGAIPIPSTIKGMKKFLFTIRRRINAGSCVTIFPEAHLWPYYTGIRPFTDTSFYYPVKFNVPVIAYCNTYSKRKLLRLIKRPRMTVYVSRPMYPNRELPPKKAQTELRDRVYQFMRDTATQHSNYEYIKYLPGSDKKDNNNYKTDT